MAYIKSFRNQNYLLPPNITDLFSEDHVCYLIEQITDDIDYNDFDDKYAGAGHPAYHPRIPLKLLLMASIDAQRSSRKIAKLSSENVIYIYLSEKTHPDFRTISNFRKDNKELLKQVALQLNKFALERGLIDLSHIITDGTTIKANANNKRTIDKETLEVLSKYIDDAIEEGIQVDEEEDKLYGDRGMHQLPKDLSDREKRKPVVQKMVEEINKALKENKADEVKQNLKNIKQEMDDKGLKKYGFTDNDSRYMKSKKGNSELSYNAQVTVDKNGLIIGNNVVQEVDDRHQLLSNINQVEEDFGELDEGTKVIADGGYEKACDMQTLDDKGYDLYVPGKNVNSDKKFAKANFTYNEEADVYISPNGEILKNSGSYFNKKQQRRLTIYKGIVDGKKKVIHALPEDKLLNQIKEKLRSEKGREIYGLRKQTVEPVIGDLKENRNFRSFSLRGIDKVQLEFSLVCLAYNLVRINNMIHKPPGLEMAAV